MKFGGGTPMHTFPEAFMRMEFVCSEGCCKEVIWNSRDGLAPNVIMNRRTKHPMTHNNPAKDFYAPGYQARPGERVFVDATPDLVRPTAVQWVENKWDIPSIRSQFSDKADFVDYVVKDWCQLGQPWIVTIEPERKLLTMKAGEVFPFICPVCRQHYPYDELKAAHAATISCTCGFIGTAKEFSEIEFEIQTWIN